MKQLILEDAENYKTVALKIDERLIQVEGSLLGYDTVGQQHFTIVDKCFLCVDRLASEINQFSYLLHVTDMAQERSCVRLPVKSTIGG